MLIAFSQPSVLSSAKLFQAALNRPITNCTGTTICKSCVLKFECCTTRITRKERAVKNKNNIANIAIVHIFTSPQCHGNLNPNICFSAAESEGDISLNTGLHSNWAPQKRADPFSASMPIKAAKPILHMATHPLDPISACSQQLLQEPHGYLLMQTTLMPKRTPMPSRLKCPLH